MAFPSQSIGFASASNQSATAADSASLDITGNLTAEGWIKFTTLPSSGANFSLIGKWVDAGNQHSYLVQLNNTAGSYGIRLINSNDGSATGLALISWTPSTGTWYHIGVVYTAATPLLELFVNGVSQGTAGGTLKTSNFNSTAGVQLSGDNASGYLNGRMVLWRLWSTTRTGAQLSTNQCTILGSTANLAAEWTFDNTYADNSGNSNTLTPANTPTFTTDIPSTCAPSGPTSVKTFDGVTQSTGVKTYLGVALASTKTVNGVA